MCASKPLTFVHMYCAPTCTKSASDCLVAANYVTTSGKEYHVSKQAVGAMSCQVVKDSVTGRDMLQGQQL